MYKFEKLDVWKESVFVLKEVYQYIDKLPEKERYNLCDQIKSAIRLKDR